VLGAGTEGGSDEDDARKNEPNSRDKRGGERGKGPKQGVKTPTQCVIGLVTAHKGQKEKVEMGQFGVKQVVNGGGLPHATSGACERKTKGKSVVTRRSTRPGWDNKVATHRAEKDSAGTTGLTIWPLRFTKPSARYT